MQSVLPTGLSRRTLIGMLATMVISAALIVLLVVRLVSASQNANAVQGSPLIGHAAPDFTVTMWNGTAGQQIHLAALKGKPVVVNFWSATCIPCQEESQILVAGAKQYADQGVVFVGIDSEDAESDGKAFMTQYGMTYPVGPDTTGQIAVAYGVLALPETVFIGRDGVVVDKFGGALSKNFLDERVAKILA